MKPKKFLTQKKIDKLQALIDDNNGVVNHEDILPLLKSYKKQLLIQRVSQQRELFDAILDFSEDLPMCTEDYHRSELWEKYKAANCA